MAADNLHEIVSADQLPLCPFFVVSEDTFMSGWGMSQGRKNILFFPCESREEAEIVYRNASDRADQMPGIISRETALGFDFGKVFAQIYSKDRCSIWFSKDRPFRKVEGAE
jgi:hypothetical protein